MGKKQSKVPPDPTQAICALEQAVQMLKGFGFSPTALEAVGDAYVAVVAGSGPTKVSTADVVVSLPPFAYVATASITISGLLKGDSLAVLSEDPAFPEPVSFALPVVQDGELVIFVLHGRYTVRLHHEGTVQATVVPAQHGEDGPETVSVHFERVADEADEDEEAWYERED
jgi:hypothetical protein